MSTYNNQGENAQEPRTMSETDIRDYDGVTLNENGEKENLHEETPFIRIKTIRLNELPWWKKALGVLGIIAFFAAGFIIVWFFLLWGLAILAVGGIIYFLKRYF